MKKKKKEINVLLEGKTHLAVFTYSGLFLILCLYYTIFNKGYGLLLLGAILFLVVQYYFMFYGKKILLTDTKIYVYVRGKKHISWDIIKDFQYVNYNEDRLGKVLNFGTLNIMNKNKEMYSYFYLANCKEMFEMIVRQYEKKMVEIDPSYQPTQEIKENVVDKID